MNQHGEDLANNTLLVDQVCRRSAIPLSVLAIEVGDDVETRVTQKTLPNPPVLLQIGILLRDGDHYGIAFFKLVVGFLQLNQLLFAERSPERTIGRDNDVLLTPILLK